MKKLPKINSGGQKWPLGVITDTLPLGSYKVVFLGNADNLLFAYDDAGSFDVLTGYTGGYSAARISLPPIEFTADTEYYMAQAEFSNIAPASVILLQRIVTNLELKRVFVNSQDALDSLYGNILHIYDTDVTEFLDNILGGSLTAALDLAAAVPFDALDVSDVEGIVDGILEALTATVLEEIEGPAILQPLFDDLGATLNANNNEEGILAGLTPLLNPWADPGLGATDAVVTINNFPSEIDFDRNVTGYFNEGAPVQLVYTLSDGDIQSGKYISIKGFALPGGVHDVQKINLMKRGLIGGLVFDNIVEGGLLLNGTFVDILDPLSEAPNFGSVNHAANQYWKSGYAFLSLGLNSYGKDGEPLDITINLGDIADLNELLEGIPILNTLGSAVISIVSGILSTVLSGLSDVLTIYFPVLDLNNLALDGGWTVLEQEQGQP